MQKDSLATGLANFAAFHLKKCNGVRSHFSPDGLQVRCLFVQARARQISAICTPIAYSAAHPRHPYRDRCAGSWSRQIFAVKNEKSDGRGIEIDGGLVAKAARVGIASLISLLRWISYEVHTFCCAAGRQPGK
jgi:hypothetical protein